MRNPTGNIYLKDSEVWRGKWGPRDDENWKPHIRKQCNYNTTKAIYEATMVKAKKNRKRLKHGKVDPNTIEKKIEREERRAKKDLAAGKKDSRAIRVASKRKLMSDQSKNSLRVPGTEESK